MAQLLGIDLGSSSVKVSLLDAPTGRVVDSAQHPADREMPILAPESSFAEQDPEIWWQHTRIAILELGTRQSLENVAAVGIAYQMHGLVMLDAADQVVRPSIIWCDSRAVAIGQQAMDSLGQDQIAATTLNSPGNFTLSKWAWVARNQPELMNRVQTVMLPGDYIALRLTGQRSTTHSGLSEMIAYDFSQRQQASFLLEHFDLNPELLPDIVPTFGDQGTLLPSVAKEFGFRQNTRLTYRAGDQPNNAFALNVLEPGETAATAGTSGVVYAVTDQRGYDRQQRVNTFLHVNDAADAQRLGILLCINGTGSAYAWLRRLLAAGNEQTLPSYEQLNAWAAEANIGSDGLSFYPWGNGAERILGNADPGARFSGLQFSRHQTPELCAAVQDGIAAALSYGMSALHELGASPQVVRAGHTNLFLSERFGRAFVQLTGVPLQLYNTDGAQGAARAAGVGAGIFATCQEASSALELVREFEPQAELEEPYRRFYEQWRKGM